MSTRFDEEIDTAWERFEARLERELEQLGEEGLVVLLDAEEVGTPRMEVVTYGGRIWTEMASNDSLAPEHQLDLVQQASLVALGWCLPSEDENTTEYWSDIPVEEARAIAPLVVGTLRHVLGVPHPDFVWVDWPSDHVVAVDEADGADESGDGEPVVGFPGCDAEMQELLSECLRDAVGAEVEQDADGDYPVFTGPVPMWVRPEHGQPVVTVFAFVVCDVRDLRQARLEIGILNARQDLWKFTLDDRTIRAQYALLAAPLVSSQLRWLLQRLAGELADIAGDTATRVRGQLWLDARQTWLEEGA